MDRIELAVVNTEPRLAVAVSDDHGGTPGTYGFLDDILFEPGFNLSLDDLALGWRSPVHGYCYRNLAIYCADVYFGRMVTQTAVVAKRSNILA